jgi:hypothetical protein
MYIILSPQIKIKQNIKRPTPTGQPKAIPNNVQAIKDNTTIASAFISVRPP